MSVLSKASSAWESASSILRDVFDIYQSLTDDDADDLATIEEELCEKEREMRDTVRSLEHMLNSDAAFDEFELDQAHDSLESGLVEIVEMRRRHVTALEIELQAQQKQSDGEQSSEEDVEQSGNQDVEQSSGNQDVEQVNVPSTAIADVITHSDEIENIGIHVKQVCYLPPRQRPGMGDIETLSVRPSRLVFAL